MDACTCPSSVLLVLAAEEVKSSEGWLQSFLRARMQARWQLTSPWLLKQDLTFTAREGERSRGALHYTWVHCSIRTILELRRLR